MSRPRSATVARLVGLDNIFNGEIIAHDTQRNLSLLQWNGMQLECPLHPEIAVGTRVDWVIPAERVVLHRRDRPSRGENENPVSGEIEDYLALGPTRR